MVTYSLYTTAANNVRRAADNLGVSLPTKYAKARKDAHASIDKARALTVSREDLAAAVAEALLADRDPATDPDVQRLATLRVLDNEGVTGNMRAHAAQLDGALLREHHQAIVKAWVPVVNAAGATIAKARDALGPFDPADAGHGGRIPAQHVRTWADARDAVTVMRHALTGVRSLGQVDGLPTLGGRLGHLLPFYDLDHTQVTEYHGSTALWEPIFDGHDVDFVTLTGYAQRLQKLRDEREKAAAEHAANTDNFGQPRPKKGTFVIGLHG
ncbi:hypothetical protein SAMN05445756_1533 [Kytococcus aerolatus]|uniref:Uncharacterized protein n=1 Tax=Kytococcus aerolatus TaxID=592308 RepID=A0A212U086_9MICO|nr:hypothetical protein [Kytococcus aerolatus]SNC71546.1 hypothetical protein SAMN05445756_1533 [Kytococcus aerolatus]